MVSKIGMDIELLGIKAGLATVFVKTQPAMTQIDAEPWILDALVLKKTNRPLCSN